MSVGSHFKDEETESWRGSVMPEVTQPVGGPGVGGEGGGEEGIPEQARVFFTTA